MREVRLQVKSERSTWGWRGGLMVPTQAGTIILTAEVPAELIAKARAALGRRGIILPTAAQDQELAGFLPVFGILKTVYTLARKHGPGILRAFRRFGAKRFLAALRAQGLPGVLRLVRAGLGGIAQTAIRSLASGESVPADMSAPVLGTAGLLASGEALPESIMLPGVRRELAVAGRLVDAGAASTLGDRAARAYLDRTRRDPRYASAREVAGLLLQG